MLSDAANVVQQTCQYPVGQLQVAVCLTALYYSLLDSSSAGDVRVQYQACFKLSSDRKAVEIQIGNQQLTGVPADR